MQLVKPRLNALEIVTEPVGDKQRFPVHALDYVLKRVELAVMNGLRVSFVVIDRSVRKLTELARQRGCVRRGVSEERVPPA